MSVRSARASSASAGAGRVTTTSVQGPRDTAFGPVLAPAAARSAEAAIAAAVRSRMTLGRADIVRTPARGEGRCTAAKLSVRADVAELVDAHGSGPCGGNP